ncbi:MAG: 30S ribosomal protein S17e [Thaumarchaeota archaeon]|jgi:small subunit ribosomal protein S17e|nr:30S ribosomal protein S17e [Candidatus Geocrenenecus arthurdayi]MCL7388614.1 30S ribosomal protein S17e [Candidatus Geocrenenecus arthurdayi]MCL7391611.1 30S ribosomal protein S17e [Candidatus Geocrenenecus arthurdayi]MCL7397000.1 30S ribosomal protein S17e [Candidatus Geocrenenecus arthurdayi]MCL7402131.1 30S ribosomal protein S17e [Candidatus Geocrenenecus arthurdayi]
MGKVRIRKVKVLAKEILKVLGDQITTDFETNKILVGQLLTGRVSKKIRNKVAGYLTTLAKIEMKKTSQKGEN